MSKLHLHLRKRIEQTLFKHGMLAEGDRVLVGVSGGADSLTLLKLPTGPLLFVPKPEFILAVYVDMGFEGTDGKDISSMEKYFQTEGIITGSRKLTLAPWLTVTTTGKPAPVSYARDCAEKGSLNWPGTIGATRWPSLTTRTT